MTHPNDSRYTELCEVCKGLRIVREKSRGDLPSDFIATDIVRVRHGRITDNWHLEDNLTFLQQIGVVTQ